MLTLRIRMKHSPGDNSEDISLRIKYTSQGALCSNISYEVSHWDAYIGRII